MMDLIPIKETENEYQPTNLPTQYRGPQYTHLNTSPISYNSDYYYLHIPHLCPIHGTGGRLSTNKSSISFLIVTPYCVPFKDDVL